MFLKLGQLFLGRKSDVFGLDIGSRWVKVVKLRQDKHGCKVIGVAKQEIVQNERDKRRKKSRVVKVIRKCVKLARARTRYAVCSICGPEVAVRRFNFGPMPGEEISHAMLFEADQVCPFDTSQCVVDYQVIGNAGNHLASLETLEKADKTRGVFVAATAEAVSRKSELVRSASLSCVLMDVDGLALLNCYLGCEDLRPDQTIAIMDIGSSFTNLAILHPGVLPFVRDLSYAGDEIVRGVAADSELSRQSVRNILFGRQEAVTDFSAGLGKACGRLISDINETLRYYAVQEGSPVEKMFVCGGFARAKGFIELLNEQLPTEVLLWNPFRKIRLECSRQAVKALEENGPAFALAAGLAMRTI